MMKDKRPFGVMLGAVLAFIGISACAASPQAVVSFDQGFSMEEILQAAKAGAAGMPQAAAEVTASVPAEGQPGSAYQRRSFTVKAKLRSETRLLIQDAVLTVSFEMASVGNARGERDIRDLDCTLELLPLAALSLPGYVMTARNPKDFYPPDASWGKDQLSWAVSDPQPGHEKAVLSFHIEHRTNIDARSLGTVLGTAVHRADPGQAYGAKAVLMLYPVCDAEMTRCVLGDLGGIHYEHWGLGWLQSPSPEFRLESESPFAIN